MTFCPVPTSTEIVATLVLAPLFCPVRQYVFFRHVGAVIFSGFIQGSSRNTLLLWILAIHPPNLGFTAVKRDKSVNPALGAVLLSVSTSPYSYSFFIYTFPHDYHCAVYTLSPGAFTIRNRTYSPDLVDHSAWTSTDFMLL